MEYIGYTGMFEFDTDLELFSGYVVDLRDQSASHSCQKIDPLRPS